MRVPLANLPPDLAARLRGQDLIIFDGECVLCSSFYRFVLRFDRHHVFRFATAQSTVGQAVYTALDLPTDDFETNLVTVDGVIYDHLDSFAAAMQRLGWPWRVLGAVRWLPVWIKTPLYRTIARNRFRILGRYDTCLMPDAAERARFVEAGW